MSETKNSLISRNPRLQSLMYSLPFLGFLVFPLISVITADGISQANKFWYSLATIVYALLAQVVWLLEDVMPHRRYPHPGLAAILLLLWAATLVAALAWHHDFTFMIIYLVPPVIMLPGKWRIVHMAMILSAVITVIVVYPGEYTTWVNLIIVLVVYMSMGATLSGAARERSREVYHAQILALQKEEQRLRLAADLHDIVGQELTAISLRAQLTANLLAAAAGDPEKLAQCQRESAEVAELTRQVLADIRAVVEGTRQVTLAEELENSTRLLASAGITASVSAPEKLAELDPASAVARFGPYLIREGCANIIHHARAASHVRITVTPQSVSVCDDGARRAILRATPASQRTGGLWGLRERVGKFGEVSWGPAAGGRGWELRLDAVSPDAAGGDAGGAVRPPVSVDSAQKERQA